MIAHYVPHVGMIVSIAGVNEGVTITLPENMSVLAIQRYVEELVEFMAHT